MGWRTDGPGWGLLRPRARSMRSSPTRAEQLLWQRLRRGQLGVRFRRQVVVTQFIADFFCPAKSLVVEVDGDVHDGREDIDRERDRMLRSAGLSVIHVRNDEVLHDLEAVVRRIMAAIQT